MKVVKKTGLVPVQDTKSGEIFGVLPAQAIVLVEGGEATLVDIPAGIETIDTSGPKPKASAAPRRKPDSSSSTHVEIPDDWQTMHHFKRIALAQHISGNKPETDDEAKVVISEELKRRTASPGSEPVSVESHTSKE